ncbi:uncharacterized protein [Panulirus ornatus]|uniref:uncharacterized protein isoform X2 n=1 Tax=Panulirus ornatus TaxID=150431 RepID=UPI003A84902F
MWRGGGVASSVHTNRAGGKPPKEDQSPEPEPAEPTDDNDVLCPLCSELYDDERHQPVLLPRCGHTFCRPCLAKGEKRGHFPCPTCRKRHLKPPVNQIPIHTDLLARAEAFRESKTSASPSPPPWPTMDSELTCAVCSEAYSTGTHDPVLLPSCGHTFCRQCLVNLEKASPRLDCPYCRTTHEGPHPAHLPVVFALLSLAKFFARSKYGVCANHSCAREFWCRTCKVGLCGRCLLEGHVKQQHTVETIDAVMQEKRAQALDSGHRRLAHITNEKASVMNKIHECLFLLCNNCEEAKALGESMRKTKDLMEDARRCVDMDSLLLTIQQLEDYPREDKPKTMDNSKVESTQSLPGCGSEPQHAAPSPNLAIPDHVGDSGEAVGAPCPSFSRRQRLNWSRGSTFNSSLGETSTTANDSRAASPTTGARGDDIGSMSPARHILLGQSNSRDDSSGAGLKKGHSDGGVCDSCEDASDDPLDDTLTAAAAPTTSGPTVGGGSSQTAAGPSGIRCESPTEDGLWLRRCYVQSEDGRLGRIRWQGGRLHMYGLTERPHHHQAFLTLQMWVVESLLEEAPEVFLDLAVGDRRLGRVYIRLMPGLRRAQHFLALALASLGPSYRGVKCSKVECKGRPGECLRVSHYLTTEGNMGSRGVLGGLEWGGDHAHPKREGLVVAASGGKAEYDGCFDICTRDNPAKRFSCPFGQVVSGLQVVREAIRHHPVAHVTIADLGVVLSHQAGTTYYQPCYNDHQVC